MCAESESAFRGWAHYLSRWETQRLLGHWLSALWPRLNTGGGGGGGGGSGGKGRKKRKREVTMGEEEEVDRNRLPDT